MILRDPPIVTPVILTPVLSNTPGTSAPQNFHRRSVSGFSPLQNFQCSVLFFFGAAWSVRPSMSFVGWSHHYSVMRCSSSTTFARHRLPPNIRAGAAAGRLWHWCVVCWLCRRCCCCSCCFCFFEVVAVAVCCCCCRRRRRCRCCCS